MPSLTSDAATRTAEVIFATTTPVRRRDYRGDYDEVLDLSEGAVDMTRLKTGRVSVLDSHSAIGLSNVIGVVEDAWAVGTGSRRQLHARIRFSERPEVEPIWQDVRTGVLGNVSFGYVVDAWEKV